MLVSRQEENDGAQRKFATRRCLGHGFVLGEPMLRHAGAFTGRCAGTVVCVSDLSITGILAHSEMPKW